MKPVIQLERTGCGIACVAALTGKSYGQARATAQALGIDAADPALWSDTQYVRRMLRHLGVRSGSTEVPFRGWQLLPEIALLATKWHAEQGWPCWHWAVFVREGSTSYVLDSKRSLKSHRRTDFGRIKPKWYIPVHK